MGYFVGKKRIIMFALCGLLSCTLMCVMFGVFSMAEAQSTVYISDAGSDSANGADASHPVKTLSAAYKKLSSGGTLVVCGRLTVKGEFPSASGKVIIKGGNASSQLVMSGDIRFLSDTAIENITINGGSGAYHIMCGGNNVTFGHGIKTTKGSAYPTIIGGIVMTNDTQAEEATFYDYRIEINSGTYNYVLGSNRRTSDKQVMGTTGNVSLVINGGSFVGTGYKQDDYAICAVGSYASQDGDYYFEINGGSFDCGIFGIGRPGINANTLTAYYKGNVHVKITGGSFKGKAMGAVQNTLASYVNGDCLFEITGGNYSAQLKRISGESVRGRCSYAVPEEMLPLMYGFERTVFVSSSGDDRYSGATNASAVASIGRACELLGTRGGTIVVCGDVSVPENFNFPYYKSGLVITSKIGKRDHTKSAKMTFEASAVFSSNVEIRDITVYGAGESTTLTFSSDVNISDTVVSEGNKINIACTDTEADRSLRLGGCAFGSISGGAAKSIDISLESGSAELITVAKQASGDVYLKLGACTVSGKISLSEGDIGGDCAIVISGAVLSSDSISVSGGKVAGEIAAHVYSLSSDAKIHFENIGGTSVSCINTTSATLDFGGKATISPLPNYLYVSDGGDGDGKTPYSAKGDLREAVIELGKAGGGTVVVCGKLELDSIITLPSDATVKICSSFAGVDWRRVADSELLIGGRLDFYCPIELEDIDITAKALYTEICTNSYPLSVGYGVHCYTDRDMGVEKYPDIVVGTRITRKTLKMLSEKPIIAEINGGTWNSVVFGSIRSEGGKATLHTVTGDSQISIGGGTFKGSVRLSGMSSMQGNLTANISGGSFLCPVYVIASPVTVDDDISSIVGDITLNITGGDFHSDIDFSQNENRNTFVGKYTLTIEGGDLRCVGDIIGADGVEGENSSTLRVSEGFNYEGKSEGTVRFKNPVVVGAADPSIYYYNGYYYYTKSGYHNGKPAIISSRSANLSDIGCAVEYVLWYETGDEGINSLWAPQLYFFDGEAYIYASCAVEGSTRRFPYVWKCTTPDNILNGEAESLGRVGKYDKSMDSWLSPRLMEYKGQLYYISAVFATASDRVSTNYKERMIIAKMESPVSFAEEKVHIIANPDKEWERYDIMEGAFALTAPDGTLYISYAANYTDKNDYCTGVLELVGEDLLSPSSWKKHEYPIQQREEGSGLFGPGATIYVNAPDGEIWAAYHIKTHADNVYACRHIMLQKLEWENGHTPVLGYPDGLWEIHEIAVNPMSVQERVRGFDTVEKIPVPAPIQPVASGTGINILAVVITASVAVILGVGACLLFLLPKNKKENKKEEKENSK